MVSCPTQTYPTGKIFLEHCMLISENVVAIRAPCLDDLGGPEKILGARAPGPPPNSTSE